MWFKFKFQGERIFFYKIYNSQQNFIQIAGNQKKSQIWFNVKNYFDEVAMTTGYCQLIYFFPFARLVAFCDCFEGGVHCQKLPRDPLCNHSREPDNPSAGQIGKIVMWCGEVSLFAEGEIIVLHVSISPFMMSQRGLLMLVSLLDTDHIFIYITSLILIIIMVCQWSRVLSIIT